MLSDDNMVIAQQKYIDEHRDSGLAGPAPQFLSQRGRPDSGKGSTIIGTALRGITGSTTRTRREQRRMRRAERRRASGRTEKEVWHLFFVLILHYIDVLISYCDWKGHFTQVDEA